MGKGFKTKKSNIKSRMKAKKKYYTKLDIFLSRMASILKVPTGVALDIFSQRTVTTIRFNTLVESPKKTYGLLRKMGATVVQVPWLDDTYIVTNMDKSDLAVTQMYKQGFFYIQNLSSMIPAQILEPNEKDTVLDMCAAPGSKTTQLASIMKNKGKIVANDADKYRIDKLRAVLEMFNVKNATVRYGAGEAIGKREEGHYDKILLDAPCSGEGLIYLKGEKPLRFWNIKKIKPMANTQKKLIESAFRALKKGGTLIYSTCTLEPEENEGVVSYLLDKFSDASIKEVDLFNTKEFEEYEKYIKRGIREYNGIKYHPEVHKSYRIIPSSNMMGFFIAKIVKR